MSPAGGMAASKIVASFAVVVSLQNVDDTFSKLSVEGHARDRLGGLLGSGEDAEVSVGLSLVCQSLEFCRHSQDAELDHAREGLMAMARQGLDIDKETKGDSLRCLNTLQARFGEEVGCGDEICSSIPIYKPSHRVV